MARITVEDCLKRIPNRFLIVNLAARRVRQIREGSEYLVSSPKNEDIVVALRELAAGKVKLRVTDALPEMQAALASSADEEQAEAPEAIEAKEGPKAVEAPEVTDAPADEGEADTASDEDA